MSSFGGSQEYEQAEETHLPCEDCGSSDALSKYSDHTYCFSCGKHNWLKGATRMAHDVKEDENQEITKGVFSSLKDRRITKEVCQYFGVTVRAKKDSEGNVTILKHYYPYYTKQNKLVANKIRDTQDKTEMPWEGRNKKATLFGMNKVNFSSTDGSKNVITITEGELDAMACFQMFGMRHNFVSVKNGARGAVRDCKEAFEELDKFDEIYICFDNDEEGKDAAKKVAILFDGKAKIVELEEGFKDPCDYLAAGKEKEFCKCWWQADKYIPSEIITGEDIFKLIDEHEEKECFDLPWEGLNKLTYGYRLGETWAFVAHAKIGKTILVREILHHILHKHEQHTIGTIFLEGLPSEHALGFLSLEANIPFHLPDAVYTEKDMADARKSFPAQRISLYKREGVIDIEQIINVMRFYIRAMGCKVVILDNLMSLVSDNPTDEERHLMNQTITRVVKLAEDTETFIILVAHLNRQNMIHGTSLLEKQANMVVELRRDTMADTPEEKNTTQVFVTFNRFSGESGLACELLYDKATGRVNEKKGTSDAPKKSKYKFDPKKHRQKKQEKELYDDEFEPDVD